MQHTSSQSPKRVHAPRARRRHSAVAYLREKGIKRGMRVALVRENSLEYIALLEGLWRVGAVAVPLNFRFPGGYIEEIVKRLNIRHVITGFDRIDLNHEGHEGHEGEIDFENDAAIILTSGSTSAEKAVLLTYGNFYYNALGSNENIELAEGDRWLLSLPLFHVGGLGILFRCFLAGADVVIPSEEETLMEAIIKYKITHLSLVSTQLQRLVDFLEENGPRDFSHLKALLLGGSAFPPFLIEKALSFGLPIFTTYGLSETASQVTTTPPGAPMEKLFTSGKPLNYRELKIINNEICVKGRTLFKGYIEGTSVSLPVDTNGWFHTGDLGYFDADGYLHVTGRKDNMFISGGENIMPEEIESILNRFSEIQQAVVVPVKDDTYGFRPAAFLKLAEPSKFDKDYLLYHLKEQLPRFKIPDTFYLWPEEITQTSLKIKRPDFQELLKKPEKLTLLFKK